MDSSANGAQLNEHTKLKGFAILQLKLAVGFKIESLWGIGRKNVKLKN